MAEFLNAYKTILSNEGGYVNDPNDAGGETYAGISRKNFPDWGGWPLVDAAKPLSHNARVSGDQMESQVRTFYKSQQWDVIKGDRINDQWIAEFIFDWYINAGSIAVKKAQAAAGVTADGNVGPQTITAINSADENMLKQNLIGARIQFYRDIVARRPDQGKFLNGWLNRVERFRNTLN